ncbi:MAG: hypothetical protein R2744_10430 [Bacteroidales bacterium]
MHYKLVNRIHLFIIFSVFINSAHRTEVVAKSDTIPFSQDTLLVDTLYIGGLGGIIG